jgi:hypothetical protein
MVEMIRSHAPSEGSRILIVSPPTINVPLLEKEGAGEMRSPEISARYAKTVMEVAGNFEKTDATIGSLDFYHILEASISADTQGSVKDYLRDGLHLGPKVLTTLLLKSGKVLKVSQGNQVLYNAIMDKLQAEWPDVAPRGVPLMVSTSFGAIL